MFGHANSAPGTDDSQSEQYIAQIYAGAAHAAHHAQGDPAQTSAAEDQPILKDVSMEYSSGSSIPKYHYHGLAVTQTQSQFEENNQEPRSGSQKENAGPSNSISQARSIPQSSGSASEDSAKASHDSNGLSASFPPFQPETLPPETVSSSDILSQSSPRVPFSPTTPVRPKGTKVAFLSPSTNNLDNGSSAFQPEGISRSKSLPFGLSYHHPPSPSHRPSTLQVSQSQDSFAQMQPEDLERRFRATSETFNKLIFGPEEQESGSFPGRRPHDQEGSSNPATPYTTSVIVDRPLGISSEKLGPSQVSSKTHSQSQSQSQPMSYGGSADEVEHRQTMDAPMDEFELSALQQKTDEVCAEVAQNARPIDFRFGAEPPDTQDDRSSTYSQPHASQFYDSEPEPTQAVDDAAVVERDPYVDSQVSSFRRRLFGPRSDSHSEPAGATQLTGAGCASVQSDKDLLDAEKPLPEGTTQLTGSGHALLNAAGSSGMDEVATQLTGAGRVTLESNHEIDAMEAGTQLTGAGRAANRSFAAGTGVERAPDQTCTTNEGPSILTHASGATGRTGRRDLVSFWGRGDQRKLARYGRHAFANGDLRQDILVPASPTPLEPELAEEHEPAADEHSASQAPTEEDEDAVVQQLADVAASSRPPTLEDIVPSSSTPAPGKGMRSNTDVSMASIQFGRSKNHERKGKERVLDSDEVIPDSEPQRGASPPPSSAPRKRTKVHEDRVLDTKAKELNPSNPRLLESQESDDVLLLRAGAGEPSFTLPSPQRNKSNVQSGSPLTKRTLLSPKKSGRDVSADSRGEVHTARMLERRESEQIPSSLPDQDKPEVPQKLADTKRSKRAGTSNSARARKRKKTEAVPPRRVTRRSARAAATAVEEVGSSISSPKDTEDIQSMKLAESDDESSSSDVPLRARKRRRISSTSRAGPSRSSTGGTSRLSGTPVPHSTKRLKSSTTFSHGATEPLEVIAIWAQDGKNYYYPGKIIDAAEDDWVVEFHDETTANVSLKNMRLCHFHVGDRVVMTEDSQHATVNEVKSAERLLRVELDNGEELDFQEVGFSDVCVAAKSVHARWKDRTVPRDLIVQSLSTTSTHSARSSGTGEPGSSVMPCKTGFVITLHPDTDNWERVKAELTGNIKRHGQILLDDWSELILMNGIFNKGNRRWVIHSNDVKIVPKKLKRVFLLADQPSEKPRFLIALALGIPCLSTNWLDDCRKHEPSWQNYLLPAGHCEQMNRTVSQMVDMAWGECEEDVVEIMSHQVPSKLFRGKSVLCLGSEFLPVPADKSSRSASKAKEASRTVPQIVVAMGAARVEAVARREDSSSPDFAAFNYVLVKDDKTIHGMDGRPGTDIVHMRWLKDCLISGRLLSVPE